MDANYRIMIFDGICNLCNGLVRFIIKKDKAGKIKFMPLQSASARPLIERYGLDPGKINSVVYISGNRCFLRSAAILNLLRDLQGGWQLMYIFIIIPRFIRDFIYDVIAANRYRIFGKRDSCMVPTGGVKDRFIG